jgi:hypothetical protein
MSITNPEIFWKGENTRLEWQSGLSVKTTRDVVWVCTSDADDSVDLVTQFEADSRTPSLGDALAGTDAILKSMDGSLADGATDIWYVRLSYAPRDEEKEEKPDENGNMTAVPVDWRDEINISSMQIGVPVERAIYRGGFVGVAGALKANGDMFTPCNSAFVPFDPGLEKEMAIRVVRITKFRSEYNGNVIASRVNKVNSDNVNINKPAYNYVDNWGPLTARIVSAGGQFQSANGAKYWRIDYEIHIHPDGWREDVVDRGLHARGMAGDPDGEGGTISMTGIAPGAPFVRHLMDINFVPITEPVLLNGDGQPLAPGLPPVFITYQKYDEVPFGPFNL